MNPSLFLIMADSPDFWEKFALQFRSEGAVTVAEIVLVAAIAAIVAGAVYWVRRSHYLDDHQLIDDPRRLVQDLRDRHHLKSKEWRLMTVIAKENDLPPAALFLRPDLFHRSGEGHSSHETKRRRDLAVKLFSAELTEG